MSVSGSSAQNQRMLAKPAEEILAELRQALKEHARFVRMMAGHPDWDHERTL